MLVHKSKEQFKLKQWEKISKKNILRIKYRQPDDLLDGLKEYNYMLVS